MMFHRRPPRLVEAAATLPGRATPVLTGAPVHPVLHAPMLGPAPEGAAVIVLGAGCFWGVERLFWSLPEVVVTCVGYAGGQTPNPTYEEVCSGRTNHTEVVRVVYRDRPGVLEEIIATWLEAHDPTQGMRQGNDVGTQYRSAAYVTSAAQAATLRTLVAAYDQRLRAAGVGAVTTELAALGAVPVDGFPPVGDFYPAEAYHQAYLHTNPNGYCGLQGTGVSCPLVPPGGRG